MSDSIDSSSAAAPQPISIWQPRIEAGELHFIRPAPLPFGDHYAARRAIPARKTPGQRRICFFGESVAAGYLYAPHLTPAQLLADQLLHTAGHDSFEVIDLARTNETLTSLVTTVQRAMQLQPDLLILFAGNNWNLLETPHHSPYYPSIDGRRQYAAAYQEQGPSGPLGPMGPIEAAARQRLDKAAAAFARIAEIAEQASAAVILIIPEVNLADWENRQPVVWLPGDATPRWHTLYQKAIRAIQNRQWQTAISCAGQMLDLDQGSCPTTFAIFTQAHLRLGNGSQARQAAAAQVDAVHYANAAFLPAPQAGSMDKALMRRAASHHQFTLIDLPELFQAGANGDGHGPLPGRHLFLDYCHLTAAGMKRAMAAVTAQLLHLTGIAETPPSRSDLVAELVTQLPDPAISPEIHATAQFGAAIHTAHRLLPVTQGSAILTHWCQEAIASSPGVMNAMLQLVAARCAPGPEILSAAQQQNVESPYRLSLQHGWRYDQNDLLLIQLLREITEEKDAAISAAMQQQLLDNLAVGKGGVDLLAPPTYLWEPLARFYPESMNFADLTERATHRAPWPVTELAFVTGGARPLDLIITARLPIIGLNQEARSGTLTVTLNGRHLAQARLTHQWRQIQLRAPHARQRQGINRLALSWPPLPPHGDQAIQAALTRLQAGRGADIHPIFGELYSLRVTPA